MTAYAGIDCGTNSLRLLIKNSQGQELCRQDRIIRLGQGVDRTGMFSQEALNRLDAAMKEYVQIMKNYHVRHIRMVATSATRDAHNRDEFFSLVNRELSIINSDTQAEVISGDQEARLTFSGAVSDSNDIALVTDLGGGSTEFAIGRDKDIFAVTSIDIGCVRITERFFSSDPPQENEINRAGDYIDSMIILAINELGEKNIRAVHTWYGVAGTFTTLAAIALGLPLYNSTRVHHSFFSFNQLQKICSTVLMMPRKDRESNILISPGRVDIICAGALIIDRLINKLFPYISSDTITVSEHDILNGIVDSILK